MGPKASLTFPSLSSGPLKLPAAVGGPLGDQGGKEKVDWGGGGNPSALTPAVQPWASTLASLCFSSLGCNMEGMTADSSTLSFTDGTVLRRDFCKRHGHTPNKQATFPECSAGVSLQSAPAGGFNYLDYKILGP